MRGPKSPLVVTLTDAERQELKRWLRRTHIPAALVRRAQAVLLVAEGKSLSESARLVGLSRKKVRWWVSCFVTHRMQGLGGRSRGERPRVVASRRDGASAEAAFLDEATKLFNSTLQLRTVLQQVAQMAAQVLGDACTIFLLQEGTDALIPTATYTLDPAQAKVRHWLLRNNPPRLGGPSATAQAAATGTPVLIGDAQTDPRIDQDAVKRLNLHSHMVAPILCKGRVLGVLGISSTTPDRHFTEQDLRAAMALADRAALAIENARLFALEQQRRHQLQTIMEINREITRELNLERLLPLIIRRAVELLGAGSGRLYRYDESAQLLRPCAWHNWTPGSFDVQLKLGEGVTGRAAAERRGFMVNDYQTFPGRLPQLAAAEIAAALAQPLLSSGQLLGVITVSRRRGTAPFTAQDLELLGAFAHQAAIALENAGLYTQEQSARAAAEAQAQQHAILIAISTALSASLSLEDILRAIGPEVLKYTHFEQLAVTLVDDDGQHWHRALLLFRASELQEGTRAPVAGTRSGWAITQRQPMVVKDLATETSPHFVQDDWMLRHGIRSSIYVPLCFGEQVFGTLNVHSSAPGVPTPERVELLQEIGHRLATAIHQARLHGALERAYRELQGAEGALRRLNNELERRVRQRTAELEAANRELEAFSYSVSHDLRAPLRAIDGFSRILLTEHAPSLAEEAQRYLQVVRENAQHMGQLIDDLLIFSRVGRQPLEKQPVAPAELVQQALAGLRSELEGRRVDIAMGELPACQADPALLKQVFVNLLENALKFTRPREVPRIEIGCQSMDGERVYFVRDNGVGFEMQYRHKLFGVFQRLHRAEEFEGTGVGLAIVQRIIHRHGGRVWAEGAVNQGATFYVTLEGGPSHA